MSEQKAPPADHRDDPDTWSDPDDPDRGQPTWSDPAPYVPATGTVLTTRDWTWSETNAPATSKVIGTRDYEQHRIELERTAHHHFMKMQGRVLLGVGLIFVLTIVALLLGLGLDWIPVEFGNELMRMVVPTVLGAGLTIVGSFFRNGGGRGNQAA